MKSSTSFAEYLDRVIFENQQVHPQCIRRLFAFEALRALWEAGDTEALDMIRDEINELLAEKALH